VDKHPWAQFINGNQLYHAITPYDQRVVR